MNGAFNLRRGIAVLEALLSVGLIGILLAIGFWALDPFGEAKLRRDELRINDLAAISDAIEKAKENDIQLPTTLGVAQGSVGSDITTASDGTGWVKMNLSAYLSALPRDPLNGKNFEDALGSKVLGEYQFISDGKYWVLRTHLEDNKQKYVDDGNDNTWYEVGDAPGMSSYFEPN